MTLGERIKKVRGNLTQPEFAKTISVHDITIGRWERGETKPDSEALEKICNLYNINPVWLLLGEGLMRRAEQPGVPGEAGKGPPKIGEETVRQYGVAAPDINVIIPEFENPDPEYFDVVPVAEAHLEAGGGAFIISENIWEYYGFHRDWLRKVTTNPRNVFLMNVKGPSMDPTIRDGDIIMVDTGRKRIYDGYIYALGIGQTIAIKRLETLPGGRIRIISDNRNEFPPYEINAQDLRLLGQVIWTARELVKRGIE